MEQDPQLRRLTTDHRVERRAADDPGLLTESIGTLGYHRVATLMPFAAPWKNGSESLISQSESLSAVTVTAEEGNFPRPDSDRINVFYAVGREFPGLVLNSRAFRRLGSMGSSNYRRTRPGKAGNHRIVRPRVVPHAARRAGR